MFAGPLVIVGVCAPERHHYAELSARALGRPLIQVAHRDDTPHPTPVQIAPNRTHALDVVAEIASDVDVEHLEFALNDPPASIICVVDAHHMIDDLRNGVALVDHAPLGDPRGDVGARARKAASFIETAALICIVGWEQVDTAHLSLMMALASHLNPHARVRLSRGPDDDLRSLAATIPDSTPLLERAGWVGVLNRTHDPYMTDRRVSAVRYEQLRPFHPGRLVRALDEVDSGRFGLVLRSAGFCRLATRAHILARWEQVGSAMWIDPLTTRMDAAATGQDLALFGLDLRAAGLVSALDAAVITDDELALGPEGWRRFADPLPAWPPVTEDAETDGH